MAWPEFSDLKTEVERITGYTESGLTSSIGNLFNDELNALATNARPLHWRNKQSRQYPKDGIIYSTVNRLYGVLAKGAVGDMREPVMYIKTDATVEATYEEKYFIGLVSVGYRPSSDSDLATFTTGGLTVHDWNMLSDAALVTWAAGAGGDYSNSDTLRWTPLPEVSVVAADYEDTAYDGHTDTITDYSGVSTGEPARWAMDWQYPLYGATDAGNETNSRAKQRAYLKIYPPPNDNYTIRAFYRRRPPPLVLADDENAITRRFPYLLVYRVAYKIALVWMGDEETANKYALAADEALLMALVNEADYMPASGIKLVPGIDIYGKRRGIRGK